MALRSWTSNNLEANAAFRQVHELPTTVELRTYVRVFATISGITAYWPFWFVEAITRESFSYVGMSKASAAACAAELIATYTKSIQHPVVHENGLVTYENKNMTVATVRASHTAGAMYQVDVDREEPSYEFEPLFVIPENNP